MKTSKRILLTVVVIFVLALIASLVVLRGDLKETVRKGDAEPSGETSLPERPARE